jgi:hypothetical protein
MLQVILGVFVAYGVADGATDSRWVAFGIFTCIWNIIMLIILFKLYVNELGKFQNEPLKPDPSYKQEFIDTIRRKVDPNYPLIG